MTHLSIHEWGRVGVFYASGQVPEGSFSRSQANALLQAARSHTLANRSGTNILVDRYSEITAQQIVGVIAAPGCSLEILPKIDAGTIVGKPARSMVGIFAKTTVPAVAVAVFFKKFLLLLLFFSSVIFYFLKKVC